MGMLKRPDAGRSTTELKSSSKSLEVTGLRVLVETTRIEQREFLLSELQRLGTWPTLVPESSTYLPTGADIVFCDYAENLPRRLPWPTGEATSALVVILPRDERFSSNVLEASTPDATLARPFTSNAIKACIAMGYSQFQYERRLRGKVAKLEENLRSIRLIERAKSIVMKATGLSDEQAYQHIRSEAMERRLPIGSLAENIVSVYESSGKLP